MEGVEDTPGAALHEGVPWGARVNFPEYLDFLDLRSYSLDIGASLAHSALRFHVMRVVEILLKHGFVDVTGMPSPV